MIKNLFYSLGLIVLLLVISAETNLLYNTKIILDPPELYLILVASLCLLLVLLTWPVMTRNKVIKIITMSLKVALLMSVLLLIFIELAIVDFAGMAFGPEVMFHFNLDAVILGLREYKYILILLLIVISLVVWFMLSAVSVLSKRWQWLIFGFSLFGYILLGHYTIVGRLYKAAKDYYSQRQLKSMSADELQKYAYLGIQPIITDKRHIKIKSTNHKNLIIVYLESFSQIFTNSPKYPNLTPNLNKLKQQYLPLSPYISSASFTMDGMITSMCGFIPDMHMGNNTLASQKGIYSALPCYPDVLQQAGYTQEFFGGAKKNFAGKNAFLLAHGFDRVMGWEDFVGLPEYESRESRNWWGLNDDDLFNRALSRLRELHQQARPFHAQVLTIGTHLKGFSSPNCESFSETSHRYIDAIHCTDQLVGQFIENLEGAGILEDTVVIITADHGVFNTELTQELFGKQHESRQLYGVIIDKNPVSSVHIETLYDLAPAVLKLVGVKHNVDFILGRDYPIKDRMLFSRHSLYKNGQRVDIESDCDDQTSLQHQKVTYCALKSALSAVKAHAQLFSTMDGFALTAVSKLVITLDKNMSRINSILIDGDDVKARFSRDGFVVNDWYLGRPGLFYIGVNKTARVVDNFILIDTDKKPFELFKKLKNDFDQPFILFGSKNTETETVLINLKKEYGLHCVFDLVCFSEMTPVVFDDNSDKPTFEVAFKSLLRHVNTSE